MESRELGATRSSCTVRSAMENFLIGSADDIEHYPLPNPSPKGGAIKLKNPTGEGQNFIIPLQHLLSKQVCKHLFPLLCGAGATQSSFAAAGASRRAGTVCLSTVSSGAGEVDSNTGEGL